MMWESLELCQEIFPDFQDGDKLDDIEGSNIMILIVTYK